MNQLLKRWFPSEAEQAEEERAFAQQAAMEREAIKQFLEVPYMAKFREWLKVTRRANEPTVAEPSDMIYRTGLRDGFRAIEQELEALEKKSKER